MDITHLINNIERNFERGFLTEKERDEAIDDCIRMQNEDDGRKQAAKT
jgi:hypothetical protein